MPTLSPAVTSLTTSVVSTTLSKVSENGTSAPLLGTSNILIGVVVELVILILVLGNLLMVVTLLLYKPWSIADLLLFSLSLSDLINGTIPAHILNVMNNFYGQNRWTPSLCAMFIWLTFSLRMTSVCTITLISAERSLMLTRPLRHHSTVTINKARIAVLVVWLFAAFIAALPFMGAGKSGYTKGYCFYQLYDLGIAFGCTIEIIGFIQLVLVLACFISIRLSSGEFIKRQSVMAAANQTGRNAHQKANETTGTKQIKQLSKMMAIVVILYYVSWLPYLLTNLVSLIIGHLPHAVEIIVGFLSLVSAIINPLLYGKMSLRYRRGYQFIFRKILSICGGEKPDGQFFDDKRKVSQVTYSTYPHALQRASVADVEVQRHTNRAFEEDEQNHNHHDKNTSSNNPAFEKDDEDDNDDDDNGIAIYPVEINKKHDTDDDDDNDDETQISICPLNESTHFDAINEDVKNPEANANGEDAESKAATVDEEDFSICPYDQSIVAHFEDLKKLVEDDDKADIGLNKDVSSSRTDLDRENSKRKETVCSQQNEDLDINIPGAVLDSIGNGIDDYNHSASLNSTERKILESPTPKDDKEGHSNGLEVDSGSSSEKEQDSQGDSDSSGSYGEGSILGNYEVAGNWNQEKEDSEDEDDGKEERKISDSSSKGSAEGNFDVMDLLEKENKPADEQVGGQGFFFVGDIVKRMDEERQKRLSMESYDLLSEDLQTNGELSENKNPQRDSDTKDKEETEQNTAQENAEEIQNGVENDENLEKGNESKDNEKVNDRMEKSENEHEQVDENGVKKNSNGKENEKEDNEVSVENTVNCEKDQQVTNGIEKEKQNGDYQTGENDNEDNGKNGQDQEEQVGDSDQSQESDVSFRGSIFKSPNLDASAKRKVRRTVSDLLRKELGEM